MNVEILRRERGQELKALRKSKGITQVVTAKMSGISHATIIRMERGKANFGVDLELRFRACLTPLPDRKIKAKNLSI
jgi:transcriptional regulator with XRE-family HTH domain